MAALVDTNVLVYRFDPRFPEKQRIAEEILRRGIAEENLLLPHQAVLELFSVVTRSRGGEPPLLPREEAFRETEFLLNLFPILYPTEAVMLSQILRLDPVVRKNLTVCRREWKAMNSSRCNDQLVGRIAVKSTRKLSGLDDDPGRQAKLANPGITERLFEPALDRLGKLQSAELHKLGDFPAGDDADTQSTLLMLLEEVHPRSAESLVAVHPPDPDVGVQENQCSASQSSSATGSVGSS